MVFLFQKWACGVQLVFDNLQSNLHALLTWLPVKTQGRYNYNHKLDYIRDIRHRDPQGYPVEAESGMVTPEEQLLN